MKQRFWEIDFLRGAAVVMMVIFHFAWYLDFFTGLEISLKSFFWEIFRIITVSAFLFLVGISLYISSHSKDGVFLKFAKRGLYIFSLGLGITLFTKIFFPDHYVFFGILHLIGVSIFLAYFFLDFKFINLFFGFAFFALGGLLKALSLDISWLYFLGFSSSNISTLDFYPIIPWFGVVLWGIFAAKILYKDRVRQFKLLDLGDNFLIKKFCFLGRNSLLIYFLHHPVLTLLVYLIQFWLRSG
ncbi:MAG: heparan-alpha-glucosaminide N-acetyltransferase [Patescibacteria group bacterium]